MIRRIDLLLLAAIAGQTFAGLRFGINTPGLNQEELEYFTSFPGTRPGITVLFAKNDISPNELVEGMYLWAYSDRRLDTLLSVLPDDGEIIAEEGYTPDWAVGWFTGNKEDYPYGVHNNRPVPSREGYYADYFEAIVHRYRPNGLLSDDGRGVTTWGLWNEPDGIGIMCFREYNEPSESVYVGYNAYFRVAQQAADRIRLVDPACTIVSGGFLSPFSQRGEEDWEDHAHHALQHMFSGESSLDGSVPFRWSTPPDAFHWHPYDDMEMPVQSETTPEWWFDPLVIDPTDLMYRDRPTSLAGSFLDGLFTGDPSWATMPQYMLEYCPSYHKATWEGCFTPGSLPEDSFFTDWRANYFITSNLLLAESPSTGILAPLLPFGGESAWWVEGWGVYEWSPQHFTGESYLGDVAYRYQACLLSGMQLYCAPHEVSVAPGISARIWVFCPPQAEPDDLVYAFRTHRTEVAGDFPPDRVYQVPVELPPGVAGLDFYEMDGTPILTTSPGENRYTLPVNGWVRYGLVSETITTCTIPAGHVDAVIDFDKADCTLTVTSSLHTRVYVFDIAGRIVPVVSGGVHSSSGSWIQQFSLGHLPCSVYLVGVQNLQGDVIAVDKIAVVR